MTGKVAKTFEELRVYQQARELSKAIYALSRQGSFARDFGLANQIRRAAVSVMSNIAEGFERGSTAEFIQFLYIAKGSCGEIRAQLQIALDQSYIRDDDYAKLHEKVCQTSGMLSKFITHLRGSDYRGEKFGKVQRRAAVGDHQQPDSQRTRERES